MPVRNAIIALAVALAAAVDPCAAQSLFQRSDPSMLFLFRDTSARHVGDLITVVVRENTDVDNRDQRASDKNSQGSFLFDTSETNEVNYSSNSGRSFNGSSQYSVEQEVSDRITVTVLDVLPNGNLVVGGKRTRLLSGEKRTLVVSGVVRPIDVRPDNTVLSEYISNFSVCYQGRGPESHFVHQGWLSRMVNNIWPF